MSENGRTLWVGNLDKKVTKELLYELFLQAGPIERLIFQVEGEGDNNRSNGQAYIVFQHSETVEYASQVLEGSCLYSQPVTMKARDLPITYKSASLKTANKQDNKGRFEDSTLRTGFNKATTWHGQSNLSPRGRDSFRNRRGASHVTQNTGYGMGYNNHSNQNSHLTDATCHS